MKIKYTRGQPVDRILDVAYKKIVPPEIDELELAMSGDIMGYDSQEKIRQRKIERLLSAVNKRFNPPFTIQVRGVVGGYHSYILPQNVEVEIKHVIEFTLSRVGPELNFVEGMILPDGQVYCSAEMSSSLGSEVKTCRVPMPYHKTPEDFANYLYKNWESCNL